MLQYSGNFKLHFRPICVNVHRSQLSSWLPHAFSLNSDPDIRLEVQILEHVVYPPARNLVTEKNQSHKKFIFRNRITFYLFHLKTQRKPKLCGTPFFYSRLLFEDLYVYIKCTLIDRYKTAKSKKNLRFAARKEIRPRLLSQKTLQESWKIHTQSPAGIPRRFKH